jgi:SCAMP family
MVLKMFQFFALVLTALALVPVGAHLFELPGKIGLPQEQYFIVQQIYRGWALFGIVLFANLGVVLALTIVVRHERVAFRLALAALACLAGSVVVFFIWTYPQNVATENWTIVPPDWAAMRTRWEYSHAANAVLTFSAFCALVLSTLQTRRP